jgi:hypothetical protein
MRQWDQRKHTYHKEKIHVRRNSKWWQRKKAMA